MVRRFSKDLKKYGRYLAFASNADLKSEVAGSYLNWLWWVLDPLFMMLIYMFIMVALFKKNIDFAPIFVFIGLTMWDMFNKTVMRCARIVKEYSSLLKRVRMPKFLLVLQTMWIYGFKMFISLALVAVMMVVWSIFPIDPVGQLVVGWQALWLLPVLAVFFLLVFAVSMIVMNCGVYVEDLRNVLQVVLRLLFYVCGVFYDVTALGFYAGYPWLETVLTKLNPVAFLMISARQCWLHQTIYEPLWMLGWTVVTVALCLLGIHLVYKNENTYIKVI